MTHLLHWALHEFVSRDASQKGSYVGPDKLTFDFSSAALTKQQVREVEKLVNEKIGENAPVSGRKFRMPTRGSETTSFSSLARNTATPCAFLQIGGAPQALNGYSMELCGGTHVDRPVKLGRFGS